MNSECNNGAAQKAAGSGARYAKLFTARSHNKATTKVHFTDKLCSIMSDKFADKGAKPLF